MGKNLTDLAPKKPLPEWTVAFLASLEDCPDVSQAAREAGITRQAAYLLRASSAEFAASWQDAIEASTDKLVRSSYKRAIDTSDTLAIFLLKSHRPSVYRENYEAPSEDKSGQTWDQVKKAHRKKSEERKARRGSH